MNRNMKKSNKSPKSDGKDKSMKSKSNSNGAGKGEENKFDPQGPPMEGAQEFTAYSYWKYPLPEIDLSKELAAVK